MREHRKERGSSGSAAIPARNAVKKKAELSLGFFKFGISVI